MFSILLAAVLFETSQGGIDLKVESETTVIDPARSVFLRVEVKAPGDRSATMPDLRDRVVGFSLVEDFAEEPVKNPDGSVVQVTNWRLVPEPCADVYKLKPFLVKASPKIYKARSDEGMYSLVGGPVYTDDDWARELTLKPGAVVESTYTSPVKMPASFRYENAKGQKFLVFAFEGIYAAHGMFRQYTRAAQLIAAAEWFGTPFPAVCKKNPFLYMQTKKDSRGNLAVGLWNFCVDDIAAPVVTTDKPYRIKSTVGCTAVAKDCTITLSRMEPWGFAALELEPAE